MKRSVAAFTAALLLVPLAPGAAEARHRPCTDRANAVLSTKRRFGLPGVYALPRRKATTLVVFAHGYRKPASVYWRHHLREAARRGVLPVAMDYRGIGPAPEYRGWNVRAGAQDSITAASHFTRSCASIRTVILVGVSMGGNTAGLAAAAGATRSCPRRAGSSCSWIRPLFDHLVMVEPAGNVTETYMEARALAGANAYAAGAVADIEREMGGRFEEVPDRYREATVTARAADVAASVRSAVVIHALEDGLVPYNQGRELATALRAEGLPVDFYTVGTRGNGEPGTTISGYLPTGQPSPFAGHASEESTTHIVMRTAFARLWALVAGVTPRDREIFVDGAAGTLPPA